MTLAELLAKTTLNVSEIKGRTDGFMGNLPMYHFHCTLTFGGQFHTFYYSKGLAHNTGKLRKSFGAGRIPFSWVQITIPQGDKRFMKESWGSTVYADSLIGSASRRGDKNKYADLMYEPTFPTVREVLSCLASDVTAGEVSFEDFCADFGYDTDSRRAYKTWESCRDTGVALTRLYGRTNLQTLIDNREEMENEPKQEAL
jgi:hypothetical protein